MKPIAQNPQNTDYSPSAERLLMGAIFAETYGFGNIAADHEQTETAGWTPRRWLQLASAIAHNSLA